MRRAYCLGWKYCRRWMFVVLLPLFGMLADYAVAQECQRIGNGYYHCTDIVGLEDNEVLIREEDMVTNGMVVFGSHEYCNISYVTKKGDKPREGARKEYDVKLKGTSTGNHFILSDGPNEIPVTFKWRGGAPMVGGSVWEELGPSGITKDQQGAFSCADKPYSQAWVRFEVASSDLQKVLPGTYTGRFSVDIGQDLYPYHNTVSFRVRLPPLIRISGFDDMTLKARNAADDGYSQDMPFCVFVSGGADYWIRASGGQGRVESFELSHAGEVIKYDVALSQDGTTLVQVNPGDWLQAGNGSSSLDCNGGTNSKVRVMLPDHRIIGKPDGIYSGIMYLSVEPG